MIWKKKTMMFGDREYVVQNKAEEAMLNKWKKVLEKAEKTINFKVDEITDMKFVNTETGETIKSFGSQEVQTEDRAENVRNLPNSDCYFYVKGDKYGPTFCCHPDNKDLDYPPCRNCTTYITNETVRKYVIDIVKPYRTSMEIKEDE